MNSTQAKAAREVLNWSIRTLATKAAVSVQTIQRLESGKVLKPKTLEDIQAALESGGVEFFGEKDGAFSIKHTSPDGTKISFGLWDKDAKSTIVSGPAPLISESVTIPRFSVEASAGAGALANDDANDGYLSVTRDWLSQFVSPGSRVSAIQARGESMEPTIRDGDLLLVNHDIQDADVAAGGIFVITHGGGVKVKRLEATANGMIRLSSDAGERYGQELIPAAELNDTLIVHGQVFWSGGRLRA